MQNPKALLLEARSIVAAAELDGRELSDAECDRCDALIDAAKALNRLNRAPPAEATQREVAA